jgi:hypothetical protein
MASSVNNLTLLINRQDSSGVNIENRSIGAISFAGVAGELDVRQTPDANIHAFDLPTPIVLQVYIKNTHATANLTITATPQGGASAVVAVVPAGGVFVYWAPVTTASAGFTAVSYTGSVTGTTFEFFLGG